MSVLKVPFFVLLLLSTVYGVGAASPDHPKQLPPSGGQATLSYASVVKNVTPAVVNIYAVHRAKGKMPNSPLLADPFFKQYFERAHPEVGKDQVSLGSGVIINKEGYILTNHHVIEKGDKIQVVLSDKREFLAKAVVKDKKTDLALLKIESPKDFPFLQVKPQEDLEVGDVVLAIGNPYGVGQTISHGIVSALARSQEGISDVRSFIQTDAPINPGNSGGPLITTDGRLVGINTAIYSKSGGSVGIGFAVPTTLAMPLIESLKNGGHILRPWIGLDVEAISSETAQKLGMDHPYGVVVKHVYPKGPAFDAGIKAGDILTSIDGKEIEDGAALDYKVAISTIGKQSTFKVLRKGDVKNFAIQFKEPTRFNDAPVTVQSPRPLQGIKLRLLSPGLALDMGLNPMQTGVVITEIAKTALASQMGFLPGDILLSVNKKTVTTKEEAIALLHNPSSAWDLTLRRGDKLINFQIKAS